MGKKDECWTNLVKVISRFRLFSRCLPCFCKYSRWRHIRKLLIHTHRRRNQLHHQLGYFCLCLLYFIHVYCTPSTAESTLLPCLFQQRPSRRLPTSTCFGLNVRVEYFYSSLFPCLGTCPSTSCRRCPDTPKLCPRLPFQASLGTVPEHGTVVFKLNQMNRTLGSSMLRSVPPVDNVLKNLLFL